jgi:predicted nucleotidyltransferase
MDLSRPLRTVVPGVDGDVLAVLVRTHAPLTGNKVSQLAGRSYAQVRHVLHRLVGDGLVLAERHGQAISYTLNRSHVVAPAIEQLGRAHEEVEERIRSCVAAWPAPPRTVAIFGSFARRDGSSDSDIDVLFVRLEGTSYDDPTWARQRGELASAIESWTGNPTQIVDLDADELAAAAAGGDPLVAMLRQDARVLFGDDVGGLADLGSGVAR